MKGIVITTDCIASIKEFNSPLYKSIGEVVDGYIEVVHPRGLDEPLNMIVNEEGLIKRLPFNPVGSLFYKTHEHGNPIVGNIILMQDGFINGEPDIVGIDEDYIDNILEQVESICAQFKNLQ